VTEPGYRVELARAAVRELERLRADDAARLRRPILALALEPSPSGTSPVTGSPFLRIRVGDLRVIYLVDDAERRELVVRIARRAESTYRRL
jgi:mRNA interferase RelE/StbE